MKPASPALIALLANNSLFFMADLWQFTLRNGTVLRYTNWDMPLTLGGNTYSASDVLCDGGKLSATVGLLAGDDEITCYPNTAIGPYQSLVSVQPFLKAVAQGYFDRAIVKKVRVFMLTPGDTTPGGMTIFVGEVVDAQPTRNTAILKMKDMRNLLNLYMPRRQFQPTCAWVFGDSNCGFNRAGQAVNSTVAAGGAGSIINCGLSQDAGFFNNGTVAFTGGVNNGLSRSVKSYAPGIIQLVAPFPNYPALSDPFTITPGCTKNFAGPSSSYAAAAQPGSTTNSIVTQLSNAPGFFTGGTILGTSGANVGVIRTISTWVGGVATLSAAFPNQPNVGGGGNPQDEFELSSVSSNDHGSCTGWWGSAAAQHFGGERFIPVPETSY